TVPRLLGAYGYFYDRIKLAVESDDLEDDFAEIVEPDKDDKADAAAPTANEDQDRAAKELRIEALLDALIEEFKVVEIKLEEGDDAQVIFETLNERGEPLLAADLVRNNIFHRADARRESAEDLFGKYWKDFEDPFWSELEKQGRYKRARIEFFLANFIAGKVASEVTLSKLFSEYKAFVKTQVNKVNSGYPTVEAELQDLCAFGALYRRLLDRNEDDPLGQFAKLLHPWDVTTVYPLVLRVWASEEMDDHNKKDCLSLLLTFIVRRAICGLTAKNYNKFFLLVLRHLEAKGFSFANLASFLTSQRSESARLPNDHEFEKAWLSAPVYGSYGSGLTSPRVRVVLEAIERRKRHKFHETQHLSTNLSVEHILPREWEEHWPLPDGTPPTREETRQAFFSSEEGDTRIGQIVRRKRLLNTFGNLTILTKPLNSSVSNGPYETKREALNEHSLLVMNREITKEDTWDEEKIEARGRKLLELAKDLWPYPDESMMSSPLHRVDRTDSQNDVC
ncbi:MAG: DUF262 domain-containing protein, partial [Rhodospirillaceae bacterium]|nr:DUF262 domain-containing protein [Rhodospirillaceae bacterium]